MLQGIHVIHVTLLHDFEPEISSNYGIKNGELAKKVSVWKGPLQASRNCSFLSYYIGYYLCLFRIII